MSRIHLLFCITLLVSAILAAPITRQKRSFKIHRVRQANYVPNGPRALRNAFVPFGFDDISFLPTTSAAENVSATAGTDEEGDVSASPTQNDAEFLSPVSIGGQTLVMDFDTGSSDM